MKRTMMLAMVVGLLAVAIEGRAQFGIPGGMGAAPSGDAATINGAGAAVVKKSPTVMRMYVEVYASGKTLDEAIGKLKTRKETAVEKLKTLKANADSITTGTASLSNAQNARRQQMELMVRSRMMGPGRKPAKAAAAKTYTVAATLTAEWTLQGKDADKLLIEANDIQERVKAAELSGAKDDKTTAAEEEIAEELAEMTRDQGVEPGTPSFVFVAKIAEAERRKALAEAFQKAKANAAESAKAAGVEIGSLLSVSVSGGQAGGGMDPFMDHRNYEYRQYMQSLIQRHRGGGEDEEGQTEAAGPDVAPVPFKFFAQAVFQLKQPK